MTTSVKLASVIPNGNCVCLTVMVATLTVTKEDPAVGGLAHDDMFAMYVQCYHNKFREQMGLVPLEWSSELAAFSKNWTTYLKDEDNCEQKHSKGDQRKNIGGFKSTGENMWKVWLGKNDVRTNPRLIARWGKKSSMGFIDEVQYFIYAGDYGGAFDCELRNTDKGIPQIGHMTQALWHSVTGIGCDWVVCPKDNAKFEGMVSCTYGPGGNSKYDSPFNETSFCLLNDIEEFTNKWGEVPRCDGKNYDCDNMDSWTTPEPILSDGKCTTIFGTICEFPYRPPWKPGFVFNDCSDGIQFWNAPYCVTTEGSVHLCPTKTPDPDCYLPSK